MHTLSAGNRIWGTCLAALSLLCAGALINEASATPTDHACDSGAPLAPNGKPFVRVEASESAGFSFPYVVYVPPNVDPEARPYLLVEPNNTGRATVDRKDIDDDAVRAVTSGRSIGNPIAERLGSPFLVPEFPRPPVGQSDLYTHSLSRDTMLVASGPLRRIDLQLAAMVADAQRRLAACGVVVNRKIFMAGYSASGMFVSRFVYLHPELVAAAEFGGVNGFVMTPVAQMGGRALTYPLGLADYATPTGHAFQRATYNAIPQFAYMGENDTNDAAHEAGDSYGADNVALLHALFRERMLPDRWQAVQRVYEGGGASIIFRTYARIGHGVDERIFRDLMLFFRKAGASAEASR